MRGRVESESRYERRRKKKATQRQWIYDCVRDCLERWILDSEIFPKSRNDSNLNHIIIIYYFSLIDLSSIVNIPLFKL